MPETQPDPPLIARFKEAFARLTPDSVMPLDDLYAHDAVFEDPLHRTEGLDALKAYFARLNARVVSAEFVLGQQVISATEAALTWVMTVRTSTAARSLEDDPFGSPRSKRTDPLGSSWCRQQANAGCGERDRAGVLPTR